MGMSKRQLIRAGISYLVKNRERGYSIKLKTGYRQIEFACFKGGFVRRMGPVNKLNYKLCSRFCKRKQFVSTNKALPNLAELLRFYDMPILAAKSILRSRVSLLFYRCHHICFLLPERMFHPMLIRKAQHFINAFRWRVRRVQ